MLDQPLTEHHLQTAGIRLITSRQLFPELHQAADAGLPMLLVENPLGRTVIALQGAHVMSFQPAGKSDMLWVSPKTLLHEGTPIRGGIPLCLPWFGPGPDSKTMHGFARVKEWNVVVAERLESGATRVVMELSGEAETCALWPHTFGFRLEIESGTTLKMTMTAQNRGREEAPLAFAFHSYFAVPDVAEATISGLQDTIYIDKMDGFARKSQVGEVTIENVTDRIYLEVPARQTIQTGTGRIHLESEAKCAVVWNAWSNDKNIPDLGEGNHVGYLCVERGDVADHAVALPPGGEYRAWMTLSV